MMSEKQAQKFHTDDTSLPRSGASVPHGKFDSTNQKLYPDLGSDASSALVSQISFGGETSGSVAKSSNVSCFLNLLFLFCNGFPAKSCVRKEGRNSILMTWITTQFWAVLPIG